MYSSKIQGQQNRFSGFRDGHQEMRNTPHGD
jgi:hypothetical protein